MIYYKPDFPNKQSLHHIKKCEHIYQFVRLGEAWLTRNRDRQMDRQSD